MAKRRQMRTMRIGRGGAIRTRRKLRTWAVSGDPMRVLPEAELEERQARHEEGYRVAAVDFPTRKAAEAWLAKYNKPNPLMDRLVDTKDDDLGVLTEREDSLGFSVTEAMNRLVGAGKKASDAARRGYAAAAPRIQQAYAYAKPRAEAAYAAAKPRAIELHRQTPRAVKIGVPVGLAVVLGLVLWNRRDRNVIRTKTEFVQKLWAALAGHSLSTASKRLLVAQAALESGWGKGTGAKKGFNYWNVTAGSWDGPTVYGWDKECYVWGYVCRPKLQRFRKYKDDAEAVRDFLRFMQARRYDKSWAALQRGNASGYAEALRDDGYYTASVSHYEDGLRSAFKTIDSVLGPAVA